MWTASGYGKHRIGSVAPTLASLLPSNRPAPNLKFHCLILETDSIFDHVSKLDLLFRFAEDQFTKQNRDGNPATFSWLNLGILCLAFSFHLIRIISQDVLSFSTKAHASIHFTSINISLLIKASVQTSLHLVTLPIINAVHRTIIFALLSMPDNFAWVLWVPRGTHPCFPSACWNLQDCSPFVLLCETKHWQESYLSEKKQTFHGINSRTAKLSI